ncbi:MAG TPA: hypothetical protein VE991_06975, partial [Acidimicrobiales bacterium]|nr:hypothetical protein [Acidimicrobiales bacterium]
MVVARFEIDSYIVDDGDRDDVFLGAPIRSRPARKRTDELVAAYARGPGLQSLLQLVTPKGDGFHVVRVIRQPPLSLRLPLLEQVELGSELLGLEQLVAGPLVGAAGLDLS